MNSTLDEPMVIETGGEQLVATANGVEARAVPLRGRAEGAELECSEVGDPAYSLRTGSGGSSKPMISVEGDSQSVGVRRLSPLECERLMNFPDGWTEGLSDSARYRALGNAVVVSVIEWIAKRLAEVDETLD